MAKRCPEEGINPWPPFVDIFSSTILVLLLFMLVLYSIIAYNSQFISKIKYQESTKDQQETSSVLSSKQLINTLSKDNETPVPVIAAEVTEQNTSKLYEGGKEQGGIVSAKEYIKEAKSEFNKKEMKIVFKDTDIFVSPQLLDEVKHAIYNTLRTNPNAKVEISVGDPKKILSATMAKQISLGRILNLKNKLKEDKKLKDKVTVLFSNEAEATQDYGYIKINVK